MFKKISAKYTLYMALSFFFLTILFIPFYIQFQDRMFVNYEMKRMTDFADTFMAFYHDDVREGVLSETTGSINGREDIEDYIKDNNGLDYEILLYDEAADIYYSTRRRERVRDKSSSSFEGAAFFGPQDITDPKADKSAPYMLDYSPDHYRRDAVPEVERVKKSVTLRKLYIIDGNRYYLLCRESLKTLDSMFAYTNRMMLILLAVYGLVCIVMQNILARRITGPIKQLSKVTDRIAKKDYSVRYCGKITDDEIGMLADNVNHMANTIQENITSLQNWNYLLHDRIDIQHEHAEDYRKAVAILTHEMKTPLAVISSQIEMMHTVSSEDKRQLYYNYCMEEIDKMSSMISRILNNSAREKSILNGSLAEIDISRMVEELCFNCRSFVESHDLHFKTKIGKGYVKHLYKEHIEYVFNNYLMNAVRHAAAGGEIRVTLVEQERAVRLTVFNEGAPIPDKDRDRVWMDFFQTGEEAPSSDEDDTYGLGLFIVKEIAAAECSRCGFINCPDGVEFWFDFINV